MSSSVLLGLNLVCWDIRAGRCAFCFTPCCVLASVEIGMTLAGELMVRCLGQYEEQTVHNSRSSGVSV